MSDHRERLEQYGVPADAVQGLIAEQLAAVAAANASPAGRWLQQHEHELQPYLRQRPDVAESFGRLAQADMVAAIDYVRLRMTEDSGPRSAPAPGTPMRTAHHDLPSGPWHSPAVGWQQREDPAAARERWRLTGSKSDAVAYAKSRLGQIISDDFLHQ